MQHKEQQIKKANEIELIAESAYREFSDAADYIWKTPRFIKKEFADELQKLPNDALDQVVIYSSGFGDELQISNIYSFLSCAYYRDFFVELCEKSIEYNSELNKRLDGDRD